jgi:sugar/nucleoside kinase (ribokinase family)
LGNQNKSYKEISQHLPVILAGVFILTMSAIKSSNREIRYLALGTVTRDFVIPSSGRPVSDIPGGSALYCAVGAALWHKGRVGVVSQVGNDFPLSSLQSFSNFDIDTRAIRVSPQPMDVRRFYSALNPNSPHLSPPSHYSDNHFQFPRALLGYGSTSQQLKSPKKNIPYTFSRFIPEYSRALIAHICSLETMDEVRESSLFQGQFPGLVSMHISASEVRKAGSDPLKTWIPSVACLMINAQALRNIFSEVRQDRTILLDLASKLGPEIVVIFLGSQGNLAVDCHSGKNWFVPNYPVNRINPTGVEDAFCGGFIAGYQSSFDLKESTLQGCISASIVAEGVGLPYALGASPDLIQTRLERLRGMIRQI